MPRGSSPISSAGTHGGNPATYKYIFIFIFIFNVFTWFKVSRSRLKGYISRRQFDNRYIYIVCVCMHVYRYFVMIMAMRLRTNLVAKR